MPDTAAPEPSSGPSGSWFVDRCVLPVHDRLSQQIWRRNMSTMTYRVFHPMDYTNLTWDLYKIGTGGPFSVTHYGSLIDYFCPLFSLGTRLGGNRWQWYAFDPTVAGVPGTRLDPAKWDFELTATARNGPHWRTFMFPEKMWAEGVPARLRDRPREGPAGPLGDRA